jgi:hypothetical protein
MVHSEGRQLRRRQARQADKLPQNGRFIAPPPQLASEGDSVNFCQFRSLANTDRWANL